MIVSYLDLLTRQFKLDEFKLLFILLKSSLNFFIFSIINNNNNNKDYYDMNKYIEKKNK